MTPSSHAVKFYEDEVYLVESVSAFVVTGLQAKGSVIVIATARHRVELDKAMAFGVMPPDGTLILFDARELLSRFMVGDWPSERRFLDLFDGIIAGASQHGPVRIFGEMVAVLMEDGKLRAALRLEELWNAMAARHRFSLLCAYPLDLFASEPGSHAFLDVCVAHNSVLATASRSCQAAREA